MFDLFFYILFKFKQMTAIYPILMLYLCEMYAKIEKGPAYDLYANPFFDKPTNRLINAFAATITSLGKVIVS
jgi:hypothetical protein